jgi:hypothetical protein
VGLAPPPALAPSGSRHRRKRVAGALLRVHASAVVRGRNDELVGFHILVEDHLSGVGL